MKKLVFFTIASLLCINGSYAKSAESLDRIIAVVNDEVVTKSELNHSLTIMKAQIAQEHIETPPQAVLQKQALDSLINKKLQMQIAKQVGINIPDDEINRVVENVAEKNNVSLTELYQRIAQDGLTPDDYRHQLREQMTIQKLQQQEVGGHLTVTTDEINRFMKAQPWKKTANDEFHVQDILIPLSDSPSEQDIQIAKEQAQMVMAKLMRGETIEEQSEDLGWRKLTEIPSVFAEHVATMKAKDISMPIQAANGFHILKLMDARSSGGSEAPNRTQVQQFLMQRKFQENVQNWISKMRSQAFITMNAKENA